MTERTGRAEKHNYASSTLRFASLSHGLFTTHEQRSSHPSKRHGLRTLPFLSSLLSKPRISTIESLGLNSRRPHNYHFINVCSIPHDWHLHHQLTVLCSYSYPDSKLSGDRKYETPITYLIRLSNRCHVCPCLLDLRRLGRGPLLHENQQSSL